MRRYLPAAVLIFIFLYGVPDYAQGSARGLSLEVDGNANINQNDVAGARDEAIQNALQNAILEAASVMLSIAIKDEKLQSVKNEIIAQPDRYINDYKITTESKQAEIYSVTLNVTIAAIDLKSDLAKIGFFQISKQAKTSLIIYLDVKGLQKYSDFSYLREFLKKRAKIVKNIYPRFFEWQQAHLDLEIYGTAQVFADELVKTGRYALDTKQINKNQVEITLLQKGEEE
jgi:hypothetical protein